MIDKLDTEKCYFLDNVFFLPMVICFIMLSFIIKTLIIGKYFYSINILIPAFVVSGIWLFCFIINCRNKKINITFRLCIIMAVFFIMIGYIIHLIWFSNYLSLNVLENISLGKTHIDTIYHSVVSESLKNYHIPSILLNGKDRISYHFFSHFIFGLIAKIIQVPTLFVYNYLYPIITLPLFIYLLVITINKLNNKCNNHLETINLVFLFIALIGVIIPSVQDKSGLFFSALYQGESCLISVIIALIFINLILRSSNNKINLLFICLVTFLTTITKVSTGFLLVSSFSYVLFRKNKTHAITYIKILILLLIFFVGYLIDSPMEIGGSGQLNFSLFNYARFYCAGKLFIIVHYVFFLFPVFLFSYFLYKENMKNPLFEGKLIDIELVFILSFGSLLPGLLFPIVGGSAFYFCIPVYIYNILIIIKYDLINYYIHKFNLIFKLLFIIVIISSTISFIKKTDYISLIKFIIRNNNVEYNTNLNIFDEINKKIDNERNNYCVYVEDDSFIYSLFTDDYNIPYKLKNDFLCASLIGVPIINAVLEENDLYYRGDGLLLGGKDDFDGYSISVINPIKRKDIQDISLLVKTKGYTKLIYLYGDTYKIIEIK